MELVYLWIEDYKNIKKQGFNFSLNLVSCYDEESKTLVIGKNDNNETEFKNFFGENINITAIVGENGSGKSSIIEFIEKLFYSNDINNYLLISSIDEKLSIYSNFTIQNIITKYEYKLKLSLLNDISLCTYNAEMPYPYENRKDLHFKNEFCTINLEEKYIHELIASIIGKGKSNIVNIISEIFKPIKMRITENQNYKIILKNKIESLMPEDNIFKDLILKDKKIKNKLVYNKFNLIDQLTKKMYKDNMSHDNFIDSKVEDDFEKNKELYRSNGKIDERPMSDDEIIDDLLDEIRIEYPLEKYISDTFDEKEFYNFFMQELYECLRSSFVPSSFYKKIKEKDLLKKFNIYKYFIFYTIVNEKLLNLFLNFIINDYLIYANNTDIKTVEELIKNIFDDTNIKKIESFLKEIGLNVNINYEEFKSLKLERDNLNNKKCFDDYYELFSFDFFDKNGNKFSDLSHGEKIFYGQILNIYFYSLSRGIKNNLLLCFDEPELSLHPTWQKEYLNKIINFIKTLDNDIHLLVTSHSPFLLSDLPKENVIFLEKDIKSKNCVNVTTRVDINPFGANIHTLLSHGFFMKDGLIGEFSKTKINKAIKYLNQVKLTEKEIIYCETIILIIGEPLIKRQLQKMLDSKRLKKLDEVDEIKSQISQLKMRLDKLEI